MRARWGLVATAIASVIALAPSSAAAFERQWHVGGGLGFVDLKHGDYSGASIGGELDLTYGLSDMFNLLAEVSLSPHNLTKDAVDTTGMPYKQRLTDQQVVLSTATVGVAYTLDVLQWVPYAGLLVGAARVSTGDNSMKATFSPTVAETRLDGVLAVGLDYQLNRSLQLGLAGRFHVVLNPSAPTDLLQIYLRAEYTWGY